MEPVYINRFKHSKKAYTEVYYKATSSIVLSILIFICYSVLAFCLYYLLYEAALAVIFEILGLLLALYTFFRIRIIADKREKTFMELYGKIPEGQTLFFDDHIFSFSETDKSELNIEYQKIKKIKQSKNFFMLYITKKVFIFVDKNNFEKGNCEEFKKFIREKSVNAKIRL